MKENNVMEQCKTAGIIYNIPSNSKGVSAFASKLGYLYPITDKVEKAEVSSIIYSVKAGMELPKAQIGLKRKYKNIIVQNNFDLKKLSKKFLIPETEVINVIKGVSWR